MHVMDLTQTIGETMPVYPGTEQPKLTQTNTIEKDGFKETLLRMYSHTGTHMDAPAHIFPGCAITHHIRIKRRVRAKVASIVPKAAPARIK